jgi:hypothetical protein
MLSPGQCTHTFVAEQRKSVTQLVEELPPINAEV